MNPLKSVLMIVALTFTAAVVLAQDRSQAQQFQEAINMMETKGNYTAAIRLFEQAAKGADRTLAARALYHVGQCYEKSGKVRAQQAYQRLIKQFGEQRQVVAQAQARLSALSPSAGNTAAGKAATGLRVQQVPVDYLNNADVSPDGRYFIGTDRETKYLTIHDLITGEKRRLANKPTNKDEWIQDPMISPDGKQIATNWGTSKDKKEHYELRIMGIDGSGSRVLYSTYRNNNYSYIEPYDWSPDGKYILTEGWEETNNGYKEDIVLISVADGSARILKSLSHESRLGGLSEMYFSPDGRYIAYAYLPQSGSSQSDISIISSDGSRDVPLVQSPSDDRLLGWAPDGKSILFSSNRSKTIDAWIIPVADGKSQGSPELVKREIGTLWPMRLTRSGSFYYRGGVSGQTRDIYTATLTPETGKLVAAPVLVKTRFTGSNDSPNWSPDGRFLVYRSFTGQLVVDTSGDHQLFILNSETGEEREVRSKLKRFNSPRWFPDGKSLLVRDWSGTATTSGAGLFKIDVETGDAILIAPEKPGAELFNPVPSRDGKAIFYQNKNILWKRNLDTGEDQEIYHPTPLTERPLFTPNIALSPEGQRLAFLFGQSLFVVSTTGGDTRELLKLRETEALDPYGCNVVWTPDGRYLLFVNKKAELWRISLDGGEPEKLGQLMGRVLALRIRPDGQRIAFDTSQRNRAGVWVMENFLPVAQPRKTAMSHR